MSFPTTRWSVLAIASLNGAPASREALEQFCRRYRPPVLEFVRFGAPSEDDPEAVTQEFFLRLLESRAWKRADRARGRFRGFLLGALKHHLADNYRRRQTAKRGGTFTHVPLEEWDEGTDSELAFSVTSEADAVFDRNWAFAIVENALETVEASMMEAGHGERFERLAIFLQAGSENPRYDTLASALRLSVAGVKTEVHRLRRRFREALRMEVARTVSAPHEIDTEMAHLHAILAASGSGEESRKLPAGIQ